MSSWLTKNPDGSYTQTIKDADQCKWLINEVCCNDSCDQCFVYPDTEEYCPKCPHFEPEADDELQN